MVFIFHRRKVVALVEFTEVDFATGLGIPQTQRVSRIGVVAGDNLVVGDGEDLFGFQPAALFAFKLHAAAEAYFVARIVAFKFPRITVLKPVVRRLFLPPVDDILLEHAVVVADAVPTSRQSQRCQRVEETRRQTTQTAVA
ncbi:hypothetical protein D3C85_1188070 [compost metagenome]